MNPSWPLDTSSWDARSSLHSEEKFLTVNTPVNTTPPITVYRRLGAALFEEAAQATGLTPGMLGARLRVELSRPTLTAPTLRAWRRGTKAVPLAALLATCRIANIRPGTVVAKVAAAAEEEPADPELVELLVALQNAPAIAGVRA